MSTQLTRFYLVSFLIRLVSQPDLAVTPRFSTISSAATFFEMNAYASVLFPHGGLEEKIEKAKQRLKRDRNYKDKLMKHREALIAIMKKFNECAGVYLVR